jgi:hypothetical protein
MLHWNLQSPRRSRAKVFLGMSVVDLDETTNDEDDYLVQAEAFALVGVFFFFFFCSLLLVLVRCLCFWLRRQTPSKQSRELL